MNFCCLVGHISLLISDSKSMLMFIATFRKECLYMQQQHVQVNASIQQVIQKEIINSALLGLCEENNRDQWIPLSKC